MATANAPVASLPQVETEARACPHCGARFPPILPAPKRLGFYSRARFWCAADDSVRVPLPRRRAGEARAIARLEPAWGVKLDELAARYEMICWVAWPQFLAEREKRYEALRELLETSGRERGLKRRFLALRRRLPGTGRQAPRVERARTGASLY